MLSFLETSVFQTVGVLTEEIASISRSFLQERFAREISLGLND